MQFVVFCESVELHICANSLLAKQKKAMKVESCLFFLAHKIFQEYVEETVYEN